MKILKGLFLAVTMFASTSAMSATEVSGDVSLVSDYIFRGISQTGGDSAAQANLKVDVNKFYISAFTSNVNFDTVELDSSASYELDLALGFANSVNDFDYDVGVISYLYPNDVSDINIDTWEVYGGGTYNIGQFGLGGKLSYTDDYFGTGTSWYTEVPVTFANRYVDVIAQVGYLNLNDAEVLNNTVDYKVGVSGHVTPSFDVFGQWTKLGLSTDNFSIPTEFKDGTWVGGVAYGF